MVLMGIVLSVGKNDVRIDAALQRLKPDLDVLSLLGKEAVTKVHDFDCTVRRGGQKLIRGGP